MSCAPTGINTLTPSERLSVNYGPSYPRGITMYPILPHIWHCSASYANVLTILAFSMERFLAICRPLYVFSLPDLTRAVLVCCMCWVCAMLASVPHLLFTR